MRSTPSRRAASLAAFVLAPYLLACINTVELPSRPDQVPSALWRLPAPTHGRAVQAFLPPTAKQLRASEEAYRALVAEFPRRPSSERKIGGRNDYAAALMYLGRVREAVAELEHTEKIFPGDYTTAANLGTAYELAGDLVAARRWIAEGITRNAADHEGTEWLHVAILDAKMQLEADPAWLDSHSVLDTQPAREPADTVRAIAYQMNERLNFVTANDPVIADLFYQAGTRVADPGVRDYFFDQSLRFGEWRRHAITSARATAKAP